MKYKKIYKADVYELLVNITLNVMNCTNCINVINIASLLETSRYQAKKYIDELRKEELVKLVCINCSDEEELYPPYWGYVLTDKGRDTDYYRQEQAKEIDLINKIFG